MDAWLVRASRLSSRLSHHKKQLEIVRELASPYLDEERERDKGSMREETREHAVLVERHRELGDRLAGLSESNESEAKKRILRLEYESTLNYHKKRQVELETLLALRLTWSFPSVELRWIHDSLEQLIKDLETLNDPRRGLIGKLVKRRSLARGVAKGTVEHESAWTTAIQALSDPKRCPLYGGISIKPQVGLVPLGQDPRSLLWEFADLQTGVKPKRDAAGVLTLSDAAGIVFVLVPGGSLSVATPEGSNSSIVEKQLSRTLSISPFFVSKYELTQAQWQRWTGENESQYAVGLKHAGKLVTARNPVERITRMQARRVLQQMGMDLPTEAQWEYAARAGTSTAWWTGNDVRSLQGACNLADRFCQNHGGPPTWRYEVGINDGAVVHARVGSYRANPFGLHDVIGNVWEWCREDSESDGNPKALEFGRRSSDPKLAVVRGGGFDTGSAGARSAYRNTVDPKFRSPSTGIRPVREIQP